MTVRRPPPLLALWIGGLTLLMLAPTLAPGFILRLDMVFVPQQTLLPWNLGIGGGLPRSVPQDALVALIAGPLSGQVLQKVVLVGVVAGAGWGAAALGGGGMLQRAAAAALYMWSPYLADRLLVGHWGLLIAYSVLPWAVLAARRARDTGDWVPLAVLCGLGAWVPTGGLLLVLAAVPVAVLPGTRVARRGVVMLVGTCVLFNAPWWLAAVRSGVAAVSDPVGLSVFGARAEGPGGVAWTVLGGGGVWNGQAALPSRGQWLAVAAIGVVLALAVIGWRAWRRERPAEAGWLGCLGLVGAIWAILSGIAADAPVLGWLTEAPPGGGLLRDGQKWIAVWVLCLAVAAPRGLARLRAGMSDRTAAVAFGIGLAALPVAATPDLAWGAFGRLHPVAYPDQWQQLRERLATDPEPGDVVSLPWAAFRRYAWNDDRVVLDPLPRYLTRTVLWNDSLPVATGGGLVIVAGDDPRAAAVSASLQNGDPVAATLASAGVRWLVLQTDQPVPGEPPNLAGTQVVWEAAGLQLRRIRGPVSVRSADDALLVAVNAIALVTWGALTVLAVLRRRTVKTGAT